MQKGFKILVLSLFSASMLWAEDEPVKRRPRIRVYDQSANLMPATPPTVDTRAAELELEKRIRKDVGAPSSLGNPVGGVSFLPEMSSSSMFNQPEKPAEEEKESWVTADNFLLEEDRMSNEDLLLKADEKETNNGEMEITDWQSLQKSMIEDALVKKEVEMTDEEIEEFLTAGKQEDADLEQSGGLKMTAVAPLENLNAQEAALDSNTARMADLDMGGFVPVLQNRTQLGGDVSRPQRERSQQLELSGSRGLLNNLKEKWNTPTGRGLESRQTGFSSPALPRESLLPRPGLEPRGLSSFSSSNPAVIPMSAPQPILSAPVRIETPANREIPVAQPQNEFRIRSTLGMPPGM